MQMVNRLRFQFNPSKFANAVAYLAQACPRSTKMTICKQLYFADKEHLVRYGRPIVGDEYHKLEHGQVPTQGLDMLRGRSDAAKNALLEKYVTVLGDSIHPKQAPNKKVFSKSDLEILDLVIEKYGQMSAAELRKLSHDEPSYVKSEGFCPIDYALFFDGEEVSEVKDLAEAEQESRDVLRPFTAR
jgi:uncharacterized phage-associated protein